MKLLCEKQLHPYQHRIKDFILECSRVGVFAEMGLGKTAATLTAIRDLKDMFAVGKILIIAPLRVANSVWKSEVREWEHLRHLKVSVCTGSEQNRIANLMKPADIYCINRENTQWLVDHYGDQWPFDMLVIDESSSFKNHQTARFKAIRKILKYTTYCTLLTGTPTSKGLMNLWSQIFLIDGGRRLGKRYSEYEARYFERDFMGYGIQPRAGAAKLIHDAVSDVVISLSVNDYLSLPERLDINEYIELPKSKMMDYRHFCKTLVLDLPEDEPVTATNAAVLAGKLMQFSNGACYTDEHGNYTIVHDEKIKALQELVDSNSNENIVVVYNFKSDLERIKEAFPKAVVLDKKQETIDKWNRGEIEMLLIHPQSAGHGLNIQHGGNIMIWFGLTWSLELDQQTCARLHRQGQGKPVRIIRLVCKDTIDERVLSILGDRAATQQQLLAAVKAEL